MSKHLIKIDNPQHVALSVTHAGLDNQYCEAGETVRLNWQPSSGWGLQEAHYTDEDGNVVSIDLSVREFTMPAKAITVSGTAKRFVIQDWTEGVGKNTKGTAFNRPTLGADDAGFEYYDETLKKKILWNGTNWVNLDGTGLYLTFIAEEDGCKVGFWQNEEAASEDFPALTISMQYSIDGGVTWDTYTVTDESDSGDINPNTIDLDKGQSVMFRGVNTQVSNYDADDSDEGCFLSVYIEGSVAATGDVTSLLNGVGGDMALTHKSEFFSMFQGCTGLTQAPALPATTLAQYCYNSMFQGCTHITSHHLATLNNSANVFQNNSACTSFTIDADTPPTIGNNTITGLKADCIIYVPAASVDAYKAKQYWSARASYIQAIP